MNINLIVYMICLKVVVIIVVVVVVLPVVYPRPLGNLSLLEDHQGPLGIFMKLIIWTILIEILKDSCQDFEGSLLYSSASSKILSRSSRISLKIFQSYPASRCRLDFICNLFALDLTALSLIKETALSSSGEKKNVLGQATRSLQGRVAQLRIRKSIGAMQFM